MHTITLPALEQASHMRDSEGDGYPARFRRALAQTHPALASIAGPARWRCPARRSGAHGLATALFCAGLALCSAAQADGQQARTARGSALPLVVDAPGPEHGNGPFPAAVLAPGQGYHLALPALAQTAQRMAARGLVVYRFDWGYFGASPRGKPSEGLVDELQDLQAAIRAARADRRVDAARVMVGGKSLGSVVAWRAFSADPQLRAALLLTPLCSRSADGSAPQAVGPVNYPGSDRETRPVALLLGDRDPGCSPPHLYAWAAAAGPSWRVGVVGGDHGFEHKALDPVAAAQAQERSVRAVADLATDFAAEVAAR